MLMEQLKKDVMLEKWDTLNLAECEEVARNLDHYLSTEFRFHKVEEHSCGNQHHHVAFFEWASKGGNHGNAFFALIPGTTVTLGYDREHPFEPSAEQLKNWEEETEEDYEMSLLSFLDTCMTPLRQVAIAPFLLEVMATDLSQPRTFHQEWQMWIYEQKKFIHNDILKYIEYDGFRFPSSDEWEYACAAGSRTLFRWGNNTPNLLIPLAGHQKIVGWDLHVRQNAFGLFIARNPYNWELCQEQTIMRGGDGGRTLHGGAGKLVAWLTLASAYEKPLSKSIVEEGMFTAHLRRAYSLF